MSGDYLAPAMRPLKAEQIGLSSHKNTYSRGVLEGNWIEEKGSWDAGTAEERRFDGVTTTRANFDNKYRCLDTVGGTSGLRAKVKPAQGLPKEYIFGHGTNLREESFVTTSQLAYEHKKKAEDTFRGLDSFQDPQERREVVRHSLVDKKRQEWEAQRREEEEEMFCTTNQKAFNEKEEARAAREAIQGKEPCKKWGELTASRNADFLKSALREGYVARHSPMVRPGEII